MFFPFFFFSFTSSHRAIISSSQPCYFKLGSPLFDPPLTLDAFPPSLGCALQHRFPFSRAFPFRGVSPYPGQSLEICNPTGFCVSYLFPFLSFFFPAGVRGQDVRESFIRSYPFPPGPLLFSPSITSLSAVVFSQPGNPLCESLPLCPPCIFS